jgi:multicomponent Na+:H+ antiporter subunit G
MIGEVIVFAGALLTLLAGIGVLRFGDVLARMHALTKASTLGMLLVLLGAAISLHEANDITSLVLAAALHLLTSPVACNLLGRATYLAEGGDDRRHAPGGRETEGDG